MSSDYSRLIFDQKKRYSAVRMQQGRVLLDSDWNAQSDINQDRLHKQTIDTIGRTGVPALFGGFELTQHTATEVSLGAGRMYVEGLLCELGEDLQFAIQNEGILIPGDEEQLPTAFIHTALGSGAHLVYLEVWQREISYLEDARLREKALGDPDTTTRFQTSWQLRSIEVERGMECDQISFPIGNVGVTPTGRMEARTISADTDEDPCTLNQTGGFSRLENQLYRIEIHQGGNRSEATFKWSRENASVQTNVTAITGGNTIRVASFGRDDEVLGFAVGNWVEVVNHESSLSGTTHDLLQIESINRSTMEMTLSGSVDQHSLHGLKVVRWDQESAEIPLTGGFSLIEEGIEVRFGQGTYQSGDYWHIPARTIDSSIEWPLGEQKLPAGIQRGFAKVGIITVDNEEIQSIQDCRKLFPPLTELPNIGGGCSTYRVSPVPGWHRVFDLIGQGEDARICFDVGSYTLDETININNKGHLLIQGAGFGTRIQASKLQVAFRFEECSSVDISHMAFGTNQVKNRDTADVVSLKGAITTVNTASVTVDSVQVSCGSDPKPQASCINCYNDDDTPGMVRITNSTFRVGYFQHGLIVINSYRTVIENNVLKTRPKPADFTITNRFRADNRTRNALTGILMTNFSATPSSETNETIIFNNANLSFRTNPDLRNADLWSRVIRDNPPPPTVNDSVGLRNHLEATVINVINSDLGNNPILDRFVASLESEDPDLGYQGIVIGGEVATDVHILRNRVMGFLQGIHVGLSHRHNSGEEYDIINSVRVEKNYIKNILPLLHTHARHGIFIGNCDRLFIERNQIELNRLSRASKVPIDAIRVWGLLGRKGSITDNEIFRSANSTGSYTTGIRIKYLNNTDNILHWNISWNSINANQKLSIPGNIFQKYLDTNG